MTRNITLQAFMDMQEVNAKLLERISIGIEAINHSNELHRASLEKNTDAVVSNNTNIKEMNMNIKATVSLLKWIVMALVIALIVLAGAEKALKFI